MFQDAIKRIINRTAELALSFVVPPQGLISKELVIRVVGGALLNDVSRSPIT